MGHVFILVLLIGGAKQGGQPMYFESLQTCNWYAGHITKRYGSLSGVGAAHTALAYCKPKYVDKANTLIYK